MVTINILLKPGALIFVLSIMPFFAASAQNYIDVDFGAVYSDVSASETTSADGPLDGGGGGIHLGVGFYRRNELNNWFYGVKLELDDVAGNLLFSLRALDIGYQFTPRFAVNGFIGVARWNLATPAYGYRIGVGTHYRLTDHWALGTDLSYSDSVARDKLVPGEVGEVISPDVFYNIFQVSLYMKYIF
jgi:opacity protein-like surface antigen